MDAVPLPRLRNPVGTGVYVSGYIRDLRSVGISVHDYDLWTEETRPIAERTLEHIRQSMNV